jgi:hypothetical protein
MTCIYHNEQVKTAPPPIQVCPINNCPDNKQMQTQHGNFCTAEPIDYRLCRHVYQITVLDPIKARRK